MYFKKVDSTKLKIIICLKIRYVVFAINHLSATGQSHHLFVVELVEHAHLI